MAHDTVDFFISRAGADAAVAKAIAATLEGAGRSTIVQDWDFGHADFVAKMDDALARATQTITILSSAYLDSRFCGAEWRAVFARDPDNFSQRLVLFRVEECQPTGLLCLLAYTDLTPVLDNVELLQQLVLARADAGTARHSHQFLSDYTRSPSTILHPNVRPTPNFTGRDAELDAIQQHLDSGKTVVLVGFGGVGKTTLAVEFGARRPDHYAGVWIIDATSDKSIQQGFISLGSVFIQGLRDTTDVAGAVAATRSVLRRFGGRPWLLVFDNVRDENTLRELLGLEGTRVLATSRLDSWGLDVARVDVGAITLEEATRYLALESGRSEADEQWRAVAQRVDRLPLALSHIAAYLRRAKVVTVLRCLSRIDELMALSPSLRDAPLSVYSTYQLAITQAEEDAPGAASVMQFLSFFRGMAMPLEALEQSPQIYPEAIRGVVAHEALRDEALSAVVRLSLAQLDATERTLRSHVLVASAARPAEDVKVWYSSVMRALYGPLMDVENPGLARARPSANLAGMSFERLRRYIGPGLRMDLEAPEYGVQGALVALGIFQTWDVVRLSSEEFAKDVESRSVELERLKTGGPDEIASFVIQKSDLVFRHLSHGDLQKATAVQLELCADIHAFQRASLAPRADIEHEIQNYVGMARDSGAKPWKIAAAILPFGYHANDPFEVDALFTGVGLDEQRLGMSLEDVKALVRQESSAAGPDPEVFLHRVDATLVNHGLARSAAGQLVQFLAQRMGVEFQHQISLPTNCGILGSDAEVGQCLIDALTSGETYSQALVLFETELRRRGAGGAALDAVLADVSAQFLLSRSA